MKPNRQQKIADYLRDAIEKLEKEASSLIDEINLIEATMKNNINRFNEIMETATSKDIFRVNEYEKVIKREALMIEEKRLKLEIVISSLAGKKANLNWIDEW